MSKRRTTYIKVGLFTVEKDAYRRIAGENGQTVSELIRQTMLEMARERAYEQDCLLAPTFGDPGTPRQTRLLYLRREQ